MKLILCAMAMALAVTTGEARMVQVKGNGAQSCGEWVTARAKDALSAETVWVLGFLSGLAAGEGVDFWGTPGAPRVNPLDNASVYLWMDNYCKANPLHMIATAAGAPFWERAATLKKAGR